MLGCRVRWVGNGKIGRGDAAPLSIRPKAGYTGISVGKVDERYVMLPIHSIVDKGARKAGCIAFLLKTHPFQTVLWFDWSPEHAWNLPIIMLQWYPCGSCNLHSRARWNWKEGSSNGWWPPQGSPTWPETNAAFETNFKDVGKNMEKQEATANYRPTHHFVRCIWMLSSKNQSVFQKETPADFPLHRRTRR